MSYRQALDTEGIMTRVSAVSLLFLLGTSLLALDRDELIDRYNKKFVVVLRDGLAIGICSVRDRRFGDVAPPLRDRRFGDVAPPLPTLAVRIVGGEAEYHEQTGTSASIAQCESVVPEPLRPGEVLQVRKAWLRGKEFWLWVVNVSPHQIERGIGAFSHGRLERGAAELRFQLDNPKDYDSAVAIVDAWLRTFSSAEEAAEFGNTASGTFVKRVRQGMTFAEVESVMGLPHTRVDLEGKTLYKYKDMTIEFRDGKVADVR
jgi:hypothetical protein